MMFVIRWLELSCVHTREKLEKTLWSLGFVSGYGTQSIKNVWSSWRGASRKRACVCRECTTHRLFSHDSKVRNLNFNSKCTVWITNSKDGSLDRVYAKFTSRCVIWNVQFKWWFERQYFGPCARQITSRIVIWNAQFKWWSRLSFELRISNHASRCDFGVHTVQTTVFRILIQNAHFKLCTLLLCENSLSLVPMLLFCARAAHSVYQRKWLDGHVAPPH